MTKYVIIGGSAGGIGGIEAIREVDPVGHITMISEEPFPQYSRPLINDLLNKEIPFEQIKFRDDAFWEKNRVETITGQKAIGLNFTHRYVTIEDESQIGFEKLLIATGGKPIVPTIEGLGKQGVFTFTTLSDVMRIKPQLRSTQNAVVLGGGLIVVGVADALAKQGVKVTIVELKDRLLNLILDDVASELAEIAFQEVGITIVTGQTVKRIFGRRDDDGIVGGVVLTDGKEVMCDLVIIAIGVVPRTELVVGTEVSVNHGIVVDRFMRTSVPDVYACGDVAEVYDFVSRENRLIPLWPVAYQGGRIAGYNMTGKKTEFHGGTTMNALKYFGLPIITIGTVNLTDGDDHDVLIEHDPTRRLYKKIVLRDGVIVGMIFVTEIERTGILFHLMKNRVDVRRIKQDLLSKAFGLISLPERWRQQMFGRG